MSHAEAFGHFRSFVVGLEKNARALRKVLEENGDDCGWRGQKRVNGSSGISSMCAEGEYALLHQASISQQDASALISLQKQSLSDHTKLSLTFHLVRYRVIHYLNSKSQYSLCYTSDRPDCFMCKSRRIFCSTEFIPRYIAPPQHVL